MTLDEIHGLSRDALHQAVLAQTGILVWLEHRPQLGRDLTLGLMLKYHVMLDWISAERGAGGRWQILVDHPTGGVQALIAYEATDVPYLVERLALWAAMQERAAL
jgi:hypothetical protein